MKIRTGIYSSITSVIVILVVLTLYSSEITSNENKIRVAFFPNIGHAVPIIGTEKGIFEEALGNQTLIETKLFDSGPPVIESLFANSIDIAYVGPGPTINGFLQSENKNIKILAGAASGGASFVVHPDSSINSVKDFFGKRIASPQIGNSQDVSLRHFLSDNGLKPAEKGGSVVVLNIPNPDIYTLFVKGEIDAAWVPEPWATILVQELGGKRLFHEEDLWPEKQFASVLLIVRSDYLNDNPQTIERWISSHIQIVKWINENPSETELVFNQFMRKAMGQSLPNKIVKESLANLEITFDPIEDSIYIFAQRADSLGYLGRHGYDLNGIFYNANSQEEEKV